MIGVFILQVLHVLHCLLYFCFNLPHSRSFARFLSIIKSLWTNKRYTFVKPFFLFSRLMNKRFLLILIVQCYVDFFICCYFLTIKIYFSVAFEVNAY